MKTYNHTFTGELSFQEFVRDNDIQAHSQVLTQVFSGVIDKEHLEHVLSIIKHSLPKSQIIGATTDGEIIENRVLTGSIIISCSIFERTTIRSVGYAPKVNDSFKVGVQIAKSLIGSDTKLLILFGDGLHCNGEEFVKGVQSVNRDVAIAGGLAGGNGSFARTYVFTGDTIMENGVVGVALASRDLLVHTAYAFDWMTIGKKLMITSSQKNRVYTIDGLPTIEIYGKYLGKEVSSKLPEAGVAFPLVVNRNGIKIARTAKKIHADGSMSFAGNMNVGDQIQFGLGNAEFILTSSSKIGRKFEHKPVESFFIYSCMARRRFMQESITIDIAPFNAMANTVGFFTYGEFFHSDKSNEFLNESMTILGLSESANKEKKNIPKVSSSHSSDQYVAINALSHLVNVTSSELETLNNDLEKEILEYHTLEGEKNRLEDVNKVKDDFINIASHELRTPLTCIHGYLSMMLDGDFGELSKELHDATKIIQKNSKYLLNIINDMLDVARFDSGKMIFNNIAFSVGSSLSDIYEEYKQITPQHHLILQCDVDASVMVCTDPSKFRQVIINLLGNAIKFTRPGGTITLKVSEGESKKYIKIEVIDTGIGISPKDHDRIFQRFGQIDSVLSRKYKGTGLGLSISKEIVSLMGGELLFISKPEKGSNFYFSLSICEKV